VTEAFPILSNLSSHGPGKYVKLSQHCVERDFSWSNHATWLIIVKQGSCGWSCKTWKFSRTGKSWKRLLVLESSRNLLNESKKYEMYGRQFRELSLKSWDVKFSIQKNSVLVLEKSWKFVPVKG